MASRQKDFEQEYSPLNNNAYFSNSYAEARDRFRKSANRAGATLCSYSLEVPSGNVDHYTIDVATLEPEEREPEERGPEELEPEKRGLAEREHKRANTLVLSSGVHGVEGFLGSAIQLAWLDQPQVSRSGVRQVLVHAINPYGFSEVRRFDQYNVDLNRNFMSSPEDYRGAPQHYHDLNTFLNPSSPPSRFEPFRAKALLQVLRYGTQALKQSIAGGQYEFPQGIFFGGHAPSPSAKVVMDLSAGWMQENGQTLHVDIHSGLGPFGKYKLLLAEEANSPAVDWYATVFGRENIEATENASGTAYLASGPIGVWLQHSTDPINYRFVTAEFGTYDPVRVLAAIRAENRAHHYSTKGSPSHQSAKKELLECFCPSNPSWREKAVASGLQIIQRAVAAFSPT